MSIRCFDTFPDLDSGGGDIENRPNLSVDE